MIAYNAMISQTNNQKLQHIFQKENPISLNDSSLYLNDYKSLQNYNWLRSQAINALNLIHKNQFQAELRKLIQRKIVNKEKATQLYQNTKKYVRIIDPFLTTMILFTQDVQILKSIQSQDIFCPYTKYILIPINTESSSKGSGNHWFNLLFCNPLYLDKQQNSKHKFCLYIFNSISGGTNMIVLQQIKKKLCLLLQLFHGINKQQIQIKQVKKVPLQQNNFDCGIYTIGFIQFILIKTLDQVEQKLNCINSNNIDEKTEVVLKNSSVLRKIYKQKLENQIIKAFYPN